MINQAHTSTTALQNTTNNSIANNHQTVNLQTKVLKSSVNQKPPKVPDVPDEVLLLFVNMIKELLGLLKPDRPSETGKRGFSLTFPAMPSYRDSESAGEPMFNDMPELPSFVASTPEGNSISDMRTADGETALKLPPLPSFNTPTSGGSTVASNSQQASAASTGGGQSASTRILRVAPLPSFVSPTTGSLSTADLPKAFNPPAIPSLTGGSSALPSVNATTPAITQNSQQTAVSTSQPEKILNVAPLPSFVSPTTGSLSTADLPKAFNPPAIPSLTAGSSALPTLSNTSSNESSPASLSSSSSSVILNPHTIPSLTGGSPLQSTVKSGSAFSSNFPSLTGGGALDTSSSSSSSKPNVFIPSLLGSGTSTSTVNETSTAVPSLSGNATLAGLSSAQGFSLTGANQLVEGLGSSSDGQKSRGNHFK